MLRLRVATAVLLVVVACGGTPPVELRTAAESTSSAVVALHPPRPDPPVPSTTLPPPPPTTTTAPPPPAPVVREAAATPPQILPSTGDCLGWASTIARYFPAGQRAKACSVMRCETGNTGDPTIQSRRSSASGLWQFLDGTWESVTGTPAPASAYSGDVQTAAAAKLWARSGWSPWSCA